MALRNRVDPFGKIHDDPARGLLTGNRGIIHDPESRTLLKRRWTTKAWIICLCEFGDRKRDVMGYNGRAGGAGWTELFFLDEVTALAAGHRPCFYCRREAAEAFRRCFANGNRLDHASAPLMDGILHGQRLTADWPEISRKQAEELPDGAMIASEGRAFAIRGGRALPWSFSGYGAPQSPADRSRLLTPPATVAALREGYGPLWHPRAWPGCVIPRS